MPLGCAAPANPAMRWLLHRFRRPPDLKDWDLRSRRGRVARSWRREAERVRQPAALPRHRPGHLAKAADITNGPAFRPAFKGNRVLSRRLHPESVKRWYATPFTAPEPTPPATVRTACAPASSPTPTCAAPPTAHRPPNPTPLLGHPRHLRPHPYRLGRQRCHLTRTLATARSGDSSS